MRNIRKVRKENERIQCEKKKKKRSEVRNGLMRERGKRERKEKIKDKERRKEIKTDKREKERKDEN